MLHVVGPEHLDPAIVRSLSRILLVTDFSPSSAAAVPFASLLTEYYGRRYVWLTWCARIRKLKKR